MAEGYKPQRKKKREYYHQNFSSPYKEAGISAKVVLDKTKRQSAVKPAGGPYFFMITKRADNEQEESS